MPYILDKDKPELNVLIENLTVKVLSFAQQYDSDVVGCMRYIALRVLEETALNAAEQYQGKRGTRYWLIVDHAGIASNIAHELFDRVVLKSNPQADFDYTPQLDGFPTIPTNASELNPEIDALVAQISKIGSPEGYNYDGAYCGIVNYSLSELVPKIVMAVYDAIGEPWSPYAVDNLIIFWLTIERELYTKVARKYEDEQIKKNGDIAAYHDILARIEATKKKK